MFLTLRNSFIFLFLTERCPTGVCYSEALLNRTASPVFHLMPTLRLGVLGVHRPLGPFLPTGLQLWKTSP